MDYDDVISHLKSSKVLVLPSSREGFGMIVIEAFACGVPVVTVNEPRNAASLLVNEEVGFVVDLDGKKLGQAILTIILNDELREKLSACAMDQAQEYDWDSIVGRLVCLYEQIIKAK